MGKSLHHSVYVIELDRAVMKDKKFMEANPHTSPDTPPNTPLYVGMTGLHVEQRLQNHLIGHKSSRYVHKYGLKLRPELYEHLNPMSFDNAVKMEKQLADELREQGYPVWQR